MCHRLALHVHHHQAFALFDKRQLLAIGRELWRRAVYILVRSDDFFLDDGGVGEVEVFLAADSSLHQLPLAVALACIHEGAVVGSPAHVGLSLWCVGDFLGGVVFNRGYKHLAAHHKCHLLAVGRHCATGGTTGVVHDADSIAIVVEEVDVHFIWLAAVGLGVDFTVVGVAKCAVGSHRKAAHRVFLERGDCCHLRRVVQREFPHIERAPVALAQEIHRLAVGAEHWSAVFATTVGEVGVLAGSHIVAPHVASDGRSVVLA